MVTLRILSLLGCAAVASGCLSPGPPNEWQPIAFENQLGRDVEIGAEWKIPAGRQLNSQFGDAPGNLQVTVTDSNDKKIGCVFVHIRKTPDNERGVLVLDRTTVSNSLCAKSAKPVELEYCGVQVGEDEGKPVDGLAPEIDCANQ